MGRLPRYLPRPGCLVEITQRTIQGRFLLRPSRRLNLLVVGALARAQEISGLRIHAVAVMSNHLHLLASPESVEQMARFMCHLKTNLSKEVGSLHRWPGPLFDRRYTMIPVSDEEEAQIQRLRYLLAQGCKEGLVGSPLDWPGVHSARALTSDSPLVGIWTERAKQWVAKQRGEVASDGAFSHRLTLRLAPIPCWADLKENAYRDRISELIEDLERETAEMHRELGTKPFGKQGVLGSEPHFGPATSKRSPSPRFHAFRRSVGQALKQALSEFLAAYRQASETFRSGISQGSFPENCFPPPSRPIPP